MEANRDRSRPVINAVKLVGARSGVGSALDKLTPPAVTAS
jgi:hypothetical protein